jgi:hypothetical protein
MRHLVTALIFIAAAALAQAKQDGDVRPTVRPNDPPKSSVATPDRSVIPKGTRDKARGKTVETIIPDICTGC